MKILTILATFALVSAGLLQETPNLAPEPYQPAIMNNRPFDATPDAGAYSFLVGGHLYGAPRNKSSIFPAASLLGNIERINATSSTFFISLGDAIRYCLPKHYDMFRSSFASRLDMPLFNAVGNHDVAIRERYLEQFPGLTAGYFLHGKTLHLILDAEKDPGRISGVQLKELLAMLDFAKKQKAISSVAIYSHKLIWAKGRDEFAIVGRHLNSNAGYRTDQSFTDDLLAPLREVARQKQVIWFSGDIGCDHTLPLFYKEESDVDLTWIATGIGDTGDDALLRVDVNQSGRMTPHIMRLDGRESQPLSSFGIAFWTKHFQKK